MRAPKKTARQEQDWESICAFLQGHEKPARSQHIARRLLHPQTHCNPVAAAAICLKIPIQDLLRWLAHRLTKRPEATQTGHKQITTNRYRIPITAAAALLNDHFSPIPACFPNATRRAYGRSVTPLSPWQSREPRLIAWKKKKRNAASQATTGFRTRHYRISTPPLKCEGYL